MRQVPLRPTMTLDEALTTAVAVRGEARLSADGETATLRELDARARALAARLLAAGVEPGDAVALLLPNGLRYAEGFFAVVRLGGLVVPLDPQLPPHQLARVQQVVPLRAVLAEAAGPAGSPPGPPTDALRVTAGAAGWVVPDQASDPLAGPARDLAGQQPGEPPVLPGAARRRSDPGAVFLTSGTTGDPKPVVLTHHQLLRPLVALQRLHAAFFRGSPLEAARRLATVATRHGTRLLRASGRQTWLTTSPFRSMAGHQVLLGCLLLGHDLVTSRSFSPRRTLGLVGQHRVNVLAGTPAVLELLLRVEDLSPYDLSSLLVIGVGGGPAAPDLVERARERFGCGVTIGYGSTELGGGVLATRLEDSLDAQSRTVGRPFPGTEVAVVDDAGHPLPDGQTGELVCRASDDGADWQPTGDLAVRRPDGSVVIVGRKDDLVIRGGQNVHPAEVEQVAADLPGVARCAAVGVPAGGDQQLWLFVVPASVSGRSADGPPVARSADGPPVARSAAPGDGSLDADVVRRHCRERLAPGKLPDRVRIVPELPVNDYGEILRRTLREHALAELAGARRTETA